MMKSVHNLGEKTGFQEFTNFLQLFFTKQHTTGGYL